MNRLVTILSLAWSAAPGPDTPSDPPPPPVTVEATVDKAVATTGDVITFTVHIKRPEDLKIRLSEPGADIGGLRLIDAGVVDPATQDGQTHQRQWYKLRADLVGSYILPPVRVHYRPPGPSTPTQSLPAADPPANESAPSSQSPPDRDTDASGWPSVQTSQIFIEVQSVLPSDGTATDIRDIKPLIRLERPVPVWVWVLSGVGLLALLGWVLFWFRRRARVSIPPPVPAHELAFAALNDLRQTDFRDAEAVRRYYFRLSEVVRAYVERAFQLNATDLTTEEILARLTEVPDLPPPARQQLQSFLKNTDWVKFAEHQPSESEISRAYEDALRFVEITSAPEPSAATSPAGAT